MGIETALLRALAWVRQRSRWQIAYTAVLTAYVAAFVAVIWIGAGLGKPDPLKSALAVRPAAAADGPDVALVIPTPTLLPVSVRARTPTPRPPTAAPAAPTVTPTTNPNAEFRVPLSASNTGTFLGHRVAIENITDDARFSAAATRPASGMKYIAVDVRVENTGNAPVNLGTWRLHTDAGGDVTAVTVRGLDTPLAPSATIAPNQTVAGTIVFIVPASTTMAWIEYQPNATAKGGLYFDAQ